MNIHNSQVSNWGHLIWMIDIAKHRAGFGHWSIRQQTSSEEEPKISRQSAGQKVRTLAKSQCCTVVFSDHKHEKLPYEFLSFLYGRWLFEQATFESYGYVELQSEEKQLALNYNHLYYIATLLIGHSINSSSWRGDDQYKCTYSCQAKPGLNPI